MKTVKNPLSLGQGVKALWLAILGISFYLRFHSSVYTDFWLDEIFPLRVSLTLSSFSAIFTDYSLDNNHPLSSLYMRAIGFQPNWFYYRIPSLIFGTGTLIVAYLIGNQYKKGNGFLLSIIFGFSHIFIIYSSEARGYSGLVFSTILSFYCLLANNVKEKKLFVIIHNLSCILGVMSHLLFIQYLSISILWMGYSFYKQNQNGIQITRSLFKYFLVPMVLFLLVYRCYLTSGGRLGGPLWTSSHILRKTANDVLGIPIDFSLLSFFGLTVFISLVLYEIYNSREKDPGLSLFYFLQVLAVPAFILLFLYEMAISVRYFLVSITFMLILFSNFLFNHLHSKNKYRYFAILILFLFLLGNIYQVYNFLQYGRGQYFKALNYILRHSEREPVTIGGNHDYRNYIPLEFYAAIMPLEKRVIYHVQKQEFFINFAIGIPWPPYKRNIQLKYDPIMDLNQAPSWIIIQEISKKYSEYPEAFVKHHSKLSYEVKPYPEGIRYHLEKVFPYSGNSGYHWILYRRHN